MLQSGNFSNFAELTNGDDENMIRVPIATTAILTLADGSQAIVPEAMVEGLFNILLINILLS